MSAEVGLLSNILDKVAPYKVRLSIGTMLAAPHRSLYVLVHCGKLTASSTMYSPVSATTWMLLDKDEKEAGYTTLHAAQHMHANRAVRAQARAVLQFYGVAYTVGDFTVCVGRAMMRPGEELRGYMVEVEYLPVQAPQLAQAALQARLVRLPSPAQSCRGRAAHAGAAAHPGRAAGAQTGF